MPKSRSPSISNTMHWLSRANSATRHSPSKPTRIAEPTIIRSIDRLAGSRAGVLGSGATVVRTPEDALRDTRVRLSPSSADTSNARRLVRKKKSSKKQDAYFSPPQSPPLPPLPVPGDEETQYLSEAEDYPLPPTRPAPLPPSEYPEDSAVENPFRPILLSEPPTGNLDVRNVIVALETSTEIYKTSLTTLLSQPSLLSDYIRSLLPRSRSRSDASSVYSTHSDSSNISDKSYSPPCRINIFLDRPSAP